MSDRSDCIELLAPLVGNEEAARLWDAARESSESVAPKDEFASALRAWLVVRGHEANRETALAIVEDTVNLMSALEFMTDERYSWLAIWMCDALDLMREQRPPD